MKAQTVPAGRRRMNKQWWRLVVQDEDTETDPEQEWFEEVCVENPEQVIKNFNNTLHPGERPRKLIAAIPILKGNGHKAHKWRKASLVTEAGGFDRYCCEDCGATGKRHGLNSYVVPDKKGPCKP